MKGAALQLDGDCHLLDHIAPLAFILKIPLIIADEKAFELCQRYYPQVECRYLSLDELSHEYLIKNFNTLFQCKFFDRGFSKLVRALHGKDIKGIFCPHGHSEKGLLATKALLLPYSYQDGVLLYGKGLKKLLKKAGVFPKKMPPWAEVGNFRATFFKEHTEFYNSIVQQEILNKLPAANTTLLYAPTWRDAEDSTSFFEGYPKLIDQLPENYNLIVKFHPLLEKRDPARFWATLKHTSKKNVLHLLDFPLVYPLLDKVDVLLSDFSSISYDFLYFQRPIFFFNNKERSCLIHKCGSAILERDFKNIFAFIEKKLSSWPQNIMKRQKECYLDTFGELKSCEETRRIIESSLECIGIEPVTSTMPLLRSTN